MNNIFNSYDSENDERLNKKFSYNYQVIKNVYPKVSELPEDEVREIIRKYYDATGTHTALYSFAAGLAKEGYDLAIKNYDDYKNNNFSWKNFKNHVKDSMKDIKNNYESSIYGLTNPDENCRVWLNDLDINTNKWKNK